MCIFMGHMMYYDTHLSLCKAQVPLYEAHVPLCEAQVHLCEAQVPLCEVLVPLCLKTKQKNVGKVKLRTFCCEVLIYALPRNILKKSAVRGTAATCDSLLQGSRS